MNKILSPIDKLEQAILGGNAWVEIEFMPMEDVHSKYFWFTILNVDTGKPLGAGKSLKEAIEDIQL